MTLLEDSAQWQKLEQYGKDAQSLSIADLFERDPKRAESYTLKSDGLYFDYSKTSLNSKSLKALRALAKAQKLDDAKKAMFSGAHINNTEDRAVLHVALRAPQTAQYMVDGRNVSDDIHTTLDAMERLCDEVHSGKWRGHNGQKIDTIVHIGIGGSDLGPYMVCDALKPFAKDDIAIHFVSNIDGAALHDVLQQINADSTLFLIASKSFTTEETLKNATSARQWFLDTAQTGEDNIAKHFAAMTVNKIAAIDFGIDTDNIFAFGDYVGGRFSLWSSIGLPIALYLGFDKFRDLLDGAYAMDEHFRSAPMDKNLPVTLALIGLWHRNFCGYEGLAILPYAQHLQHFPAYLQQTDMESNGKEIDRHGRALPYGTGPAVFGASGTNGQHAFYQHIHQSKVVTPCEFIALKTPPSTLSGHHNALLSHVIAQSRALMIGRKDGEALNHAEKHFSGSRPSTTLILDALTPFSLGQLLALYEHKIFVQGHIWGLNSFDQPGVELGKILAKDIAAIIAAPTENSDAKAKLDPSTQKILSYLFEE
jgi:glucose-6-phosphate isomerase